ncbi:MAG: DUF1924 domain-containing protein [Betaproteobacteria bacterium]|nr:DUF1924 domain-containing protein [Betaproteobacteria bacterium]
MTRPLFPALALAGLATLSAMPAQAVVASDLLRGYETAARAQSPAFQGFSADRGGRLFRTPQGGEWSCASCHGETPTGPGRHAKTAKVIQPLAPAANPQRFTDAAQVEKWFKRNCGDVLKRECTAQEKGDILSWLVSVK